jgi:hypothetical protein
MTASNDVGMSSIGVDVAGTGEGKRELSVTRPRCLDAALDYAKRGISVIPLHGIVDERCTCGKADCTKPGKHPIGSWKQAQSERASAEELAAAFSRQPNANIGIVTGAISNLVVIDIDGPDGFASISSIEGEPPLVPTVKTGNGYHLYGRHPGGTLKNFVKSHPGLDGRADGGYVVAPASRHASGREYHWTRPLDTSLPDLPPQLLSLFSSSEGSPERSVRRRAGVDPAEEASTAESVPPHRRVPAKLKDYAEKALADECSLVAAAPVGHQEATLSAAGLKIGHYVGAQLVEFTNAQEALIEAGLRMVNDPKRSSWTRAEISTKVTAKLREGMKSPKWGPDPRGADGDQSPPLDIFGETRLTGPPAFPLDALPVGVAEFVADRAERLGVDHAMIAMPLLAVCAAALDDRHVVQVRRHDQQWVESARLWVAIVEEPGGKKTPAIAAAIEPIRAIENRWIEEDTSKLTNYQLELDAYQEARRKAVRLSCEHERTLWTIFNPAPKRPPQRRLIVSDITTESLARILADNPAGVIGLFDELAQLLGSFDAYRGAKATGRDRAIWLQLYNGGSIAVDRVGSGYLSIPNWSACIVGGIQPELMRKLMPNLSEDGLLQRFIPIFGSGPSMGNDRVADDEADQTYHRLLQTLTGWRALPPTRVRLSAEAHEARERVMEFVNARQILPHTPGPLKNHLSKWEALFARLLLTLHAIEVASAHAAFGVSLEDFHEIRGSTARSVERLMTEYLLPSVTRFYRDFCGRSEHVQHACWVAGHILAHGCQSLRLGILGALTTLFEMIDRRLRAQCLAWNLPGGSFQKPARIQDGQPSGGSTRGYISSSLIALRRSGFGVLRKRRRFVRRLRNSVSSPTIHSCFVTELSLACASDARSADVQMVYEIDKETTQNFNVCARMRQIGRKENFFLKWQA